MLFTRDPITRKETVPLGPPGVTLAMLHIDPSRETEQAPDTEEELSHYPKIDSRLHGGGEIRDGK